MLYNKVEKNPAWLECARQGAEFLEKFGHDGNYDFYFSLTREGKPIIQPYNIFSNTFACMAFAQLAVATGDEHYADIARKTFRRILERRSNPKGIWSKGVPGTRPMKDFALPMIICNMALEIEPIIEDKSLLDKTIEEALHEVFDVFYQPDLGVMVENLAPDGSLIDCFEGRKVNPGHDLEALWFMMNLGLRLNRQDIIDKSMEIALRVIDYGWDKEYGGIFYFMDRKGYPTQELEWDQKLWWVHLESAICMIKGYQLTGNEKCLEWFEKLDNYLWTHFKEGRGPVTAQGRQVEGLLPRAPRPLSDKYNLTGNSRQKINYERFTQIVICRGGGACAVRPGLCPGDAPRQGDRPGRRAASRCYRAGERHLAGYHDRCRRQLFHAGGKRQRHRVLLPWPCNSGIHI